MARSWSRQEVEATVTDYLDMFEAELRGEDYNKAAHNRTLRELLDDRSKGAVERKHQNISAILIELGLPYISGYKPLSNYQQLLHDVVEDRLTPRRELRALITSQVEAPANVPSVADILERLVDPPRPGEARSANQAYERPRGRRSARRVDYLALETRNASLGLAGEEFVANFERARLIRDGHEALSDRVEHVAVTQGDGLGFDVLSFDPDGSERFIEVKTTAYGRETPFYATENEVSFSRQEGARYHLYRPFQFRRDARLFTLTGPLEERCHLLPTQYRARVR